MELIESYLKQRNTSSFSMKLSMKWNKEKKCYEWYEPPKPEELIREYKWRYLTPIEHKMLIA